MLIWDAFRAQLLCAFVIPVLGRLSGRDNLAKHKERGHAETSLRSVNRNCYGFE